MRAPSAGSDALGAMMPGAEAAKVMRTAILEFQQKPRMAKATLESRARERRVSRGRGCGLRQRVADGAQQVGEPEGLDEPTAAALFEKSFGVCTGDVPGDKDDASRQRGGCRGDRAVKASCRRRAASSDRRSPRRSSLTHAGEGLLAIARVVNLQPGIRQRFPDRRRQRPLVLNQQNRAPAPRSIGGERRLGAAWPAPATLTGSSTKERRAAAGGRVRRGSARRAPGRSRRPPSARGLFPSRFPWS